jgi:hypothetical protein
MFGHNFTQFLPNFKTDEEGDACLTLQKTGLPGFNLPRVSSRFTVTFVLLVSGAIGLSALPQTNDTTLVFKLAPTILHWIQFQLVTRTSFFGKSALQCPTRSST